MSITPLAKLAVSGLGWLTREASQYVSTRGGLAGQIESGGNAGQGDHGPSSVLVMMSHCRFGRQRAKIERYQAKVMRSRDLQQGELFDFLN